ncbi:kinase-like domain-containing protein [Pyronema omphalodes]|nr:kinase-like domain-containing protein [Pyronema omphalodes]
MSSASSTSTGPTCNPEERIGQILAGRLELTGILGIGAYGVVYNAVDIYSYTPYAVKALSKNGMDARQKRFQQREIALHLKASAHPNVVSLVKVVETADCTFVIMEYCPEGDLFTNITERGNYVGNDELARAVFIQLLDAVEYCHQNGIYHRDLKPENVLVANRGYEVKLADFGLATTDAFTNDFGCGSTFYMSPECQQSSSRTSNFYASAPNDVWSLGVILVNLTCGRNPWKRASTSDSTYRAYLKDRSFLRTILPLSNGLNQVLQRVFDPNPNTRIGIQELRARISALPRLTNGPGMVSAPASPEPLDEDFLIVDSFDHAGYYESAATGTITPPDSAPATPHNQSVIHPYAYSKAGADDVTSPSACYPDSESSSVVLPTSLDFIPSGGRSFWNQFPLFRREEYQPHHGVRVF